MLRGRVRGAGRPCRHVERALRRSPPGRSPGLNGIPVELYRTFSEVMAPVLAAVHSAIGHTGRVPSRLLEGVMTQLYKAGDATSPANHRPIPLLGTDYRVLAKVLAFRLEPVLQQVVGLEQAAFLPGRRIGDNILLL